ncbi:MAG: sugar phosphate isomerase/epimerase [Planctomycetaceae bacterium]|nr:sugar phosphate isomerase/epimerase [Planctomycetaceae bacterium]
MFIAASTHCLSDMSFADACYQISEMEYDCVEIWMDENSDHLKPSSIAEDPERFVAQFREVTRLTPVAFSLNHDIELATLIELAKAAKLLKFTQITVPAAPLGTPFNTEIDRLRAFVQSTSIEGIQVSIKTEIGHLTEDPRTAVELCQSVKGLGLTLDPSHYICGPHTGKSYDMVFPYVHHVQLRDTSPKELQVQIGLGEVDYNRLISMLEAQEYNLALSVDLIPELLKDLERPLEMRKMRMLLDSLL